LKDFVKLKCWRRIQSFLAKTIVERARHQLPNFVVEIKKERFMVERFPFEFPTCG
jgi:hypothetical protein